MLKDFLSHIEFDLRPHHMTVIADEIIAETLYPHQHGHQDTQHKDRIPDLLFRHIDHRSGNVAHDQRDHQRGGRPQKGEEHVRRKNPPKGLIIT